MASAQKENATHPVTKGKRKCELTEERESKREKEKILANNTPKYLKCEQRIKENKINCIRAFFLNLKKQNKQTKIIYASPVGIGWSKPGKGITSCIPPF